MTGAQIHVHQLEISVDRNHHKKRSLLVPLHNVEKKSKSTGQKCCCPILGIQISSGRNPVYYLAPLTTKRYYANDSDLNYFN